MRHAATVLAGLAIAAAAQTFAAPPAAACSCAAGIPDAERRANADAVFTGRIETERGDDRTVVWTFAVDAVYKGDVAERQVVSSSASGSSCGAELLNHTRYLVFARGTGGALTTGLCDGDRALADGAVPALALGAATTPRPATSPAASGPAFVDGPVVKPAGRSLAAPFLVAVLVAAVAAGGVVAWRRERVP
jgi:hypothetical protein